MKKINSILTRTKKTLTATYGRLIGISLINILAGIAAGSVITNLPSLQNTLPQTTVIGISILATLLFLLAEVVSIIAISVILTQNKSFKEAIEFGITKGMRSIPVLLLLALLLFAGSMPGFLIFSSGVVMAHRILTPILVLLGIFLFFLPIMIQIRGIFVLFIWLENRKEKAWLILKKSFALTQGSVGWKIMLFITTAAIGMAIAHWLLLSLLSAAGGVLTPGLSEKTLSTFTDRFISVFFLMPVMYTLIYTLYEYAKKRKGNARKKNA